VAIDPSGHVDPIVDLGDTCPEMLGLPDGRIVVWRSVDDDSDATPLLGRLNADYSVDSTFLSGMDGPDGRIHGARLEDDGDILIYGNFAYVNGVESRRIARLAPDGSIVEAFSPEGSSTELVPMDRYGGATIQLLSDGSLLVNGRFDRVQGVRVPGLARLYGRDPSPPTIVADPDGTVACAGGEIALRVDAEGTPLNYRWSKDGVEMIETEDHLGTRYSTLTLRGLTEDDAGKYSVTVSNVLGEDVSLTAIVTVDPDCATNEAGRPGAEGASSGEAVPAQLAR